MTENSQGIDFFKNGLCMHCSWARGGLYDFRHFHTETEDSWAKKDSQLQNRLNEQLKKYPEQHHQDIIESYSYEIHQHQNQFPNIHRESLIITIYNFLEKHLNQLCKILSQYFSSTVKLQDLKGRGVTRALIYLSKVAHLDFTKINKEKEYINNVNKLRNTVVHNGGILPEKIDDPLNIFVTKNMHLHGSPNNELSLEIDFIYELIDTLISFFEKLDCEVQMFITNQNA
jgi:DNA-directed RNA polymerase subunit F